MSKLFYLQDQKDILEQKLEDLYGDDRIDEAQEVIEEIERIKQKIKIEETKPLKTNKNRKSADLIFRDF